MIKNRQTKIVNVIVICVISLFLTSCSAKKIELPHGWEILEINSQVKMRLHNIVFPNNGSIMGFSLNKNYIYGWYRKLNINIYFIFNFSSGKVQEGDFYQIEKLALIHGFHMPNMSDEITYSQFFTKNMDELQKIFQHKKLKIKKTFYGFLIYTAE